MSKSPLLLPRDDYSNSTTSAMLETGTLEKHIPLHHLACLHFLPHSMRLKLWTDTVYPVSCDIAICLIERLIWCLQLVYFLVKALNSSRHNPCFVINNCFPSNHLLSDCIRLSVDIWSAIIKDLLPCFFLLHSTHPSNRGHLRTSGVGAGTIGKEL